MAVSSNNGTSKSSFLIGFSIIFTIHFGVALFLETSHMKPIGKPYWNSTVKPPGLHVSPWHMVSSLTQTPLRTLRDHVRRGKNIHPKTGQNRWHKYIKSWLVSKGSKNKPICRDCAIYFSKTSNLGGGFKYFWNFHPGLWGNDPIWLSHICQVGWNHQPVVYTIRIIGLPDYAVASCFIGIVMSFARYENLTLVYMYIIHVSGRCLHIYSQSERRWMSITNIVPFLTCSFLAFWMIDSHLNNSVVRMNNSQSSLIPMALAASSMFMLSRDSTCRWRTKFCEQKVENYTFQPTVYTPEV